MNPSKLKYRNVINARYDNKELLTLPVTFIPSTSTFYSNEAFFSKNGTYKFSRPIKLYNHNIPMEKEVDEINCDLRDAFHFEEDNQLTITYF